MPLLLRAARAAFLSPTALRCPATRPTVKACRASSTGGPTDWGEELERRRRERLEGTRGLSPNASGTTGSSSGSSSGGSSGSSSGNSSGSSDGRVRRSGGSVDGGVAQDPKIEEAAREEMQTRARELQLFAYPSTRRFPWATAALLLASGGLTAATSFQWIRVAQSQSIEELRERLDTFLKIFGACSLSYQELSSGSLHALILASLLRAGERPAREIADVVVLVSCGTLLEQIYGPARVLGFAISSMILSNTLAVLLHEKAVAVPIGGSSCEKANLSHYVVSTSGATVALGALCTFLNSRWAALPGLPVPVLWLLAPVLASDATAAASYFRDLPAYRAAIEGHVTSVSSSFKDDAPRPADEDNDDAVVSELPGPMTLPSSFRLAAAAAACGAAEECVRRDCRQPPEDIAEWRLEIETASEAARPVAPDGAFWADIAGVLVALFAAVLLRRPAF